MARVDHSLAAIVAGGLIAGTLDIGMAVTIYHVGPMPILKAIASGLFGRAALLGGPGMALLGLVLQWAMSLIIAAIFVLAARRFAVLWRQWLWAGLAYGVVIFLVMNFVVVPLSAVPSKGKPDLLGLLAMLVFGLIISACTKWFASRPAPKPSLRVAG